MKTKYDNDGYGPFLDYAEDLSHYIILSESAYRLFIESLSKNPQILSENNNIIFNLIASNAKNTSFSIRLLSTWGQPNEGYMLLRIRLEQLIVCSYLIHENEENGLLPFINFYPRIEQNIASIFQKNKLYNAAMELVFPELKSKLDEKIKQVNKIIDESFEFDNGQLKRKWTKLKINEMASRRDQVTDNKDIISKFKLIDYYNTTYKIASSLIHSDAAAISTNFIGINPQGGLTPHFFYIFTNLIQNAHFDIIQCYEISKRLNLGVEQEYTKLYDDYLKRLKNDWKS